MALYIIQGLRPAYAPHRYAVLHCSHESLELLDHASLRRTYDAQVISSRNVIRE